MKNEYVLDRVSNQAIRSMSYIFFKTIEVFNIDEEASFNSPFEVKSDYDKLLVQEFKEFLNQISMLFLDIESGFPDADKSLSQVEKILVSELSKIDAIDDSSYIEKVKAYIRVTNPKYMQTMFDNIIVKAKERKELYSKLDKDPSKYAQLFSKIINEVMNIYEKSNGEPKVKPFINCPVCEVETDKYACAWEYNKHVHFFCENCEFSFMQ